MRKPIITANWKMYKSRADAAAFCAQLLPLIKDNHAVEAVICAPYTTLDILADNLAATSVKWGAQNFYPKNEGAYTGEISPVMLQELGVRYIIIGHSERRSIFGETDQMIKDKLEAAFDYGFSPILCVGETLAQREAGETLAFCVGQLAHATSALQNEQMAQLVVAYEPIWAIGTGKTATAQDAEAVISQLRNYLEQTYGSTVAQQVRMQYGGSVKPDNIAQYLAQPNIDGALVGGASLASESFAQLVNYQKAITNTPVVLMVLDGWGLGANHETNAIYSAETPSMDDLFARYPHNQLICSGEAVGLPPGQQGNSEVGHLNLGAGRVVYQELTRINKAIKEQSFEANRVLVETMDYCNDQHKALHLMGLVSPGGVHSHTDHLLALVQLAKAKAVKQIYIHCFLDGRDVAPRSGLADIADLEQQLIQLGVAQIATICGRYYAMDRDHRWDRVEQAYNGLVKGQGRQAVSAVTAIEQWYAEDMSDEFVLPTVLTQPNGQPVATIKPEDAVIFFNFRADRGRELTKCFSERDFTAFARGPFLNNHFVTMTQYEEGLNVQVAYPPQNLQNTLGEVLAKQGVAQFRIAETEKYAHVTFFFNGGIETTYPLEERLLVPSPQVATYDLQPEMSAKQVTEQCLKALDKKRYQFILINFANTDMVGHTGDLAAAKKAVEVVDQCVGRIVQAVTKLGGTLILTADHGNAEQMVDEERGCPYTAHTANAVPVLVVNNRPCKVQAGTLQDIAPTILNLLDIPKPQEMTGNNLIQFNHEL